MPVTTNARLALAMMLEKFENDVLPGEAGWDAVESARAALAEPEPPALSPRELQVAFAALKYLRWTHPHSLNGRAFSTDHGRVEIEEVDDLCNKLDVTAKTE